MREQQIPESPADLGQYGPSGYFELLSGYDHFLDGDFALESGEAGKGKTALDCIFALHGTDAVHQRFGKSRVAKEDSIKFTYLTDGFDGGPAVVFGGFDGGASEHGQNLDILEGKRTGKQSGGPAVIIGCLRQLLHSERGRAEESVFPKRFGQKMLPFLFKVPQLFELLSEACVGASGGNVFGAVLQDAGRVILVGPV